MTVYSNAYDPDDEYENGSVDVYKCGKVDLRTGYYSTQTCSSSF